MVNKWAHALEYIWTAQTKLNKGESRSWEEEVTLIKIHYIHI